MVNTRRKRERKGKKRQKSGAGEAGRSRQRSTGRGYLGASGAGEGELSLSNDDGGFTKTSDPARWTCLAANCKHQQRSTVEGRAMRGSGRQATQHAVF